MFPPKDLVLTEEEHELRPDERRNRAREKLADMVEQLKRGERVDGVFKSQLRGGEGIAQKLWTLCTIAFVRTVSSAVSASCGQGEVQGDNQVIEVKFRVPDEVPLDLPKAILESRLEAIYEELVCRSNLIGLPLKREETWMA